MHPAMAPSPGRIVLFHPTNKDAHGNPETPVPAIIQAVLSGAYCRLVVLGERELTYEQNVAQGTGPGQWSFSPAN